MSSAAVETPAAPVEVAPASGKPAPTLDNKPRHLPAWKVLLHNDDKNDVQFVAETIVLLTPHAWAPALVLTKEAHEQGVSLLLTTHRERAELYHDQFTSRGLTVTIEPTE